MLPTQNYLLNAAACIIRLPAYEKEPTKNLSSFFYKTSAVYVRPMSKSFQAPGGLFEYARQVFPSLADPNYYCYTRATRGTRRGGLHTQGLAPAQVR